MNKQTFIIRVAERISRGEAPRKAETKRPSAPERVSVNSQTPPSEWEDFLVNLATNYAA